jgi:hypothetical protein
MTDRETEPEPQETDNVRQMRETIERLKGEVESLRGEKRETMFREAGFPLDTGQGEAINIVMEKSDSPVSVEEIQRVARDRFKWEAQPEAETPSAPAEPSETAQIDSRIDQVTARSTPKTEPEPAEQHATARDEALRRARDSHDTSDIYAAMYHELRRAGIEPITQIEE